MTMDLVSIILPTYNRESTIIKSIRSVLDQTYINFELIIVDDCSTDNTEKLIYEINEKRIRYIKNETNKGPSEARNIGINMARGNYIAFQDSDDIWMVDKLQKQMDAIKKDDELGIVYTAYNLICDESSEQYIPSKSIDKCLKDGYIYESLLKENKIGTPTILIKKEAIVKYGGFDHELKACEDWELCIRIAKHYKVGFIDECLVNAYSSINGVNSNIRNIIEALCYILIKYYNDIKNYPFINDKISTILEYCVNYDSNQIKEVRNKLFPDIINSLSDFDALLYQAKRTCKFKNYYDILIKIMNMPDIEEYLKNICNKNDWKSIAIYGMGNIGELLYRYFENSGIDVKYGIDKNSSSGTINMKILKPNEIKNDIDLILITIPFDYMNIIQNLRQYTDCNILTMHQFFGDCNK